MIFISLKIFIFLMLCAAAGVAGISIYAYRFFLAEGYKAQAENLFFIGLCTLIALFIGFACAIAYSRKKRHEINRITKMARTNGVLAVDRFGKLGSFGKKMQSLFEDILTVSEMRSIRITYLNNVITTICNHIAMPLIIVDLSGTIQYVSHAYIKKLSENEQSIVGLHFLDVYSDVNFDEIISLLEKNGSEYTVKTEKMTFQFLPIFSKDNTLAGICTKIEKNSLLTQGSTAVKQLYESVIQQKEIESVEHLETTASLTPTPKPKASLKNIKNIATGWLKKFKKNEP